jgi:large subunit ribosomal protein L23
MAILYALTTEKSVSGIEKDNKLVFIVEKGATKQGIKDEVLKTFGEKVAQINMINAFSGKKKAIVKFAKKGAAQDVASKLKLI